MPPAAAPAAVPAPPPRSADMAKNHLFLRERQLLENRAWRQGQYERPGGDARTYKKALGIERACYAFEDDNSTAPSTAGLMASSYRSTYDLPWHPAWRPEEADAETQIGLETARAWQPTLPTAADSQSAAQSAAKSAAEKSVGPSAARSSAARAAGSQVSAARSATRTEVINDIITRGGPQGP